MKRLRYYPWLLLLFAVPLATQVFFSPASLRARQHLVVADFKPIMSPQAEQALVEAAQQAQNRQRGAALRNLPPVTSSELPSIQTVYVAQTGHHLSDRAGFLKFWRENGGALIFGYPLSEETIENGRVVQYFEKARFEFHPEQPDRRYQVQLSLLGRELTNGWNLPLGDPANGEVFFPETGHTLSGKFLRFWQKRGGLRIFGYPISEPMEEVSPVDGQTYLVQYFERARFEYHPEALDSFYQQHEQMLGIYLAALHEVQLSDLGRQIGQATGTISGSAAAMAGAPEWSAMIWRRRIDVNLSTQTLTAYENNTAVYHAPVATGKDGFNTPTGSYAIYSKTPLQTMIGEGNGETWNVPNIPWVQYIVGGVAFHGTYWHDAWGTGVRLSHGCVNLNIDDAQWLYEWADIGTQVDIHF